MITMLEEDWGVSEQGTEDYVYPESHDEQSWYDKLKEFIGKLLFGN